MKENLCIKIRLIFPAIFCRVMWMDYTYPTVIEFLNSSKYKMTTLLAAFYFRSKIILYPKY